MDQSRAQLLQLLANTLSLASLKPWKGSKKDDTLDHLKEMADILHKEIVALPNMSRNEKLFLFLQVISSITGTLGISLGQQLGIRAESRSVNLAEAQRAAGLPADPSQN